MLDLVAKTTSTISTGGWEETYKRCVGNCRQTHAVYAFGHSVRGKGWDACMKGCDNVAIAAARQEGVLPTVYKQILPRMREAIEKQAFTATGVSTGAATAKMNKIACISICKKKYTGFPLQTCIRNCETVTTALPQSTAFKFSPFITTQKPFTPLIPSTRFAPTTRPTPVLTKDIPSDTDIVSITQPMISIPGVYEEPAPLKPGFFSRIPTWGWVAGAGALALLLAKK